MTPPKTTTSGIAAGTLTDREGLNLRRFFRDREVNTVLDASCSPGTQAISLARLGYTVTAADQPWAAGTRPRKRRAVWRRGPDHVRQSDFQSLHHHLTGPFDVVLTKGNSIPHLLHDEQIEEALLIFHELLRPGGLLLIGMRDFEPLLEDRPRFWPGVIHDGPEEQIITFDIWDWNDDEPATVTFNRFIVRGDGTTYQATKRPVRLRALTAAEVEVVLLEVGFENIQSHHDRWELLITAIRPA